MSALSITASNISKSFLIGTAKHNNLRDSISALFKNSDKKQVEEFWALRDVNLNIYAGDSIGIIGKNGAGKSTFLKILSKITKPTTGKIEINGRLASLLEVGTGFHPELTGYENIFLNGTILGMSRKEIKKKLDEIIDFSGIEHFLYTPVKHYSSGMYTRLAFAVAAHLEPDILVIDEVLAVGDMDFQKKCLGKMDEVSKSGRTVLFVSHQMGMISQLCKKSVLLENGTVALFDSTPIVIERYSSGNNSNNIYEVDSSKKKIYFKKIYTCNETGVPMDYFGFDEKIYVKIIVNINNYKPNQKICFTIVDKMNNYVSTTIKPLDDFNSISNQKHIQLTIPRTILAPNFYSIRLAIFSNSDTENDVVENICRFQIFDTGTHLSEYEGIDYGNVFMDFKWDNYE